MAGMHSSEHQSTLSQAFHHLARISYDRAWLVLAGFVLLAGWMFNQLSALQVDMSAEAMLHKNDPVRVNYRNFKQIFGSDDVVIVSLPTGGTLNNELLTTVVELHQRLEDEVPFVDEITSLYNARYSFGEDDELMVEDLLEGWPTHRWTAQTLTEYVLQQESYLNRLISDDGEHLAILVELSAFADIEQKTLLDPKQSQQAVQTIRAITDEYSELDIALTGKPVIHDVKNVMTLRDSGISSAASLLLTLLFTTLFFRRISGVLLPLLVVYGSIIGAAALMAITGAPFTLTISVVFPLMVAVGVADSVHILNGFFRSYQQQGDKREAIIGAMAHAAPAVFLTSLTTAAGFISFVSGDLASTADLGIYAAAAVMIALVLTVMLLPALIAVFPIRQHVKNQGVHGLIEGFLDHCSEFARRHAKAISFSAIAAMGLGIWGSGYHYFSYDPISQFPDHVIEKQDNYAVDEQYSGNSTIEVLLDSGKAYGVYEPGFIRKLDHFSEQFPHTEIAELNLAQPYSVLNILKETHRALNGNKPEFYALAEDKQLIAQELLLFEINNRDDLLDVVDEEFRTVRLTLKVQHEDAVKYEQLVRELEQQLWQSFAQSNVVITGNAVLSAESVPKALRTMTKSYIIAACMVVVMMMVMVRSVRLGLISIIPNLLPILLVLNLMVVMKWPLDMASIMFGAIAMGVVVDDTLHFFYHFKQNYRQSMNTFAAAHNTLHQVGPAMFITTVIFACSAGSNMLSELDNVFAFGATMSLVTVLALLADLIVAPALLIWLFDRDAQLGEQDYSVARAKEPMAVPEKKEKEGEAA